MGYIMDLRKTIGARPLIMAGTGVILVDRPILEKFSSSSAHGVCER